jgi:hypothetical protein
MKLKRTSRRLIRRIALGLAVVAVAAPSAGAYLAAPVNDDAVNTAALAHAYNVWQQNGVSNGGDEAASALADFYRSLPGALAGGQVTAGVGNGYVSAPSGGSATGFSRPESGVQDVTGSVGPSWVAPGLVAPADPAADGFRTAVSNLTESSLLRNYDMIPHHILDQTGRQDFAGPIGFVSRAAPAGDFSGPIGFVSRPESGAVIPADLSGRQFGPAALPAESAPVTAPQSRVPVADSGEGFTWDDATIGIVAGLGTALVAALAGIAVMGRRDRLARA